MDDLTNAVKGAVKRLKGEDEEYELSIKLDKMWERAEPARKQLDWKWFQYDLWTNGNHYAKWDKATQQIISTPKSDGRPKVTINKIYVTLRSVRSYVIQNRPKAEVSPANMTNTPEDLDQAYRLNLFLDYLHESLSLRQKLRASLWHALKYSVGFWQVLYNEQDGEVSVKVVDPYDLYIDPTARTMGEARYFILAVKRNIEDLKEDPKYKDTDWSKIKTDSLMAASSLKSRLLSHEMGQVIQNDADSGTVIVKEYWYKEYDKKTGKHKYMLCTKAGDQVIRKAFDTELDRFPFFRLCSDVEPLSLYGNGWVKNLVPLNRLLNKLESSVAEYNDMVNKGRLIAPKGAGIRVITNQHGQIIEGKAGLIEKLVPLQVPALNPAVMQQINNVNRYIEDVSSYHDASLGRIPTGAHSGVSIEALKEGDSNNLSELVENTEEFLEDVYEYILYLISQKYQFARNIVTETTTGEKEFIQIIGEGAEDTLKTQGTVVVPQKNLVDVKITSWLAYTSEGKRNAIKDLSSLPQMANLPPEYILQAYEIGPIANILKQMKQAQQDQQQEQLQMQKQQQDQQLQMQQQQQIMQTAGEATKQQMSQQIEQQTQPEGAGRQQAIAFVRALLNGQMPDLPKNVSPSFIQYLDEFMQSPEAQGMGGELLKTIQLIRDKLVLQLKQ